MNATFAEFQKSIHQVHRARAQAETLRNQLFREYERLGTEESDVPSEQHNDPPSRSGREALRKAIAAADCAIASIDQALREMEQVRDDPT